MVTTRRRATAGEAAKAVPEAAPEGRSLASDAAAGEEAPPATQAETEHAGPAKSLRKGSAIEAALRSATQTASYNVIVQLALRVITFVSNAIIIRHVSKEFLGVVNVRLMLLYSTVIFLAREAFIKACLSANRHERNKAYWAGIVNLCWLVPILGLFWSTLLGFVWTNLIKQPDLPGYEYAVMGYAAAAVIELLAVPALVIEMIHLRTTRKSPKLRRVSFLESQVVAEGAALTVNIIIRLALVMLRPEWGLFNVCLAQLAHAATYLVYICGTSLLDVQQGQHPVFTSVWDMLPRSLGGKPWYRAVNKEMAAIAWAFSQHGILKQLLTEGERYLMTVFGLLTFSQQGVYDVVHNLGSLPIEDNYYPFFAALLERNGAKSSELSSEGNNGNSSDRRPSEAALNAAKAASEHDLQVAGQTLSVLFKLMILVGATIAAFGQGYAQLLLHIYGGRRPLRVPST
ncbi:uncharacterized protein MONBRDRAFT_22469 [Monosiga brevicollis MX1]|uniref:Protein RFT1 homolog n=1 Tax=Monosiga brevicollis TaxID=81824 RepID=A9UQN8_MONBE|nr:uncharacterized protein MONBRDRAFT_22469 [Monosiga brevicollis MX1]EDQ93077.1 predicted protein [Monosiga brevicollis MX1]|eukprot:XP_001742839.1 hypothetical protein [Monosiga brevicollis MX1]